MKKLKMSHWLSLLCLVIVLVFTATSCINHKELIVSKEIVAKNMEHVKDYQVVREDKLVEFKSYRIQPYDQILIHINAFDGSTEEFLNRAFASENSYSSNIDYSPESLYFSSYSVSEQGYVTVPILGKMKVAGLTINQLKDKLDEDYSPYLKYSSTSIKVSNRRYTILGEINDPGVHYLYNEKNTLLDAISMAGDFTDFANLKAVKLIRQTPRGTETVYLNLSRPDFIYTKYYYVAPNDIIYVEPLKEKAFNVNSDALGIIISAISLLAVTLNAIFR